MCTSLKLFLTVAVASFAEASFVDTVCKLSSDPGKACEGSEPPASKMYYFDTNKERCLPFDYLGCEGNKNKFSDSDECIDACQTGWFLKHKNDDDYDTVENRVPEDCNLKPEPGPCKALIAMWYYNPESKSCSGFGYGGCQGNKNMFDTEEGCLGFCKPKDGNATSTTVTSTEKPGGS